MFSRILNSIAKGGKALLVTLIGSALGAALLALKDIHPTGLAGIVWSVAGYSMATAFVAALMRMIGYDPTKDEKVSGPLVPLKAVPAEAVPEVVANVAAAKEKG